MRPNLITTNLLDTGTSFKIQRKNISLSKPATPTKAVDPVADQQLFTEPDLRERSHYLMNIQRNLVCSSRFSKLPNIVNDYTLIQKQDEDRI